MMRWRYIATALAAVCVFVTTYALILPAITIEKSNSDEVSGMYLDTAETPDVVETPDSTISLNSTAAPDATKSPADYCTDIPTPNTTQLRSSGETYEIIVNYDESIGIPKDAHLEVREIVQDPEAAETGEVTEYDTYVNNTLDALGLESESISYARIFDICIKGELGEEYQPAEGTKVDVRIELPDKELSEEAAASTHVVHFADEASAGDVVETLEVEGTTVCFEAESFSAYAIVDGITEESTETWGWQKIATLGEFVSHADSGLIVGHSDGFYFTDETYVVKDSRTGIRKTEKPGQSYPRETAKAYYFEEDPANAGCYYAYCVKDGVNWYVKQSSNSLTLVNSKSNASSFMVNCVSDTVFTVKARNNDYYWNQQGDANGNGFAAYNQNNQGSKLNFWYYLPATCEPYDLDGKTFGLMSWNDGASGKALMADNTIAGENRLDAKALTVMTNSNNETLYASNDETDLTMWIFEWAGEDKYYLKTSVDGGTRYLQITSMGLSMVDTPDESCKIQVTAGSGAYSGQISLKSGSTTLTYNPSADENDQSAFGVGGSAGSEWLHFVELSELTEDYFLTHTAEKVSVSDQSVTNGSRVIVYTRVYNNQKNKYEYYAVDHDGSLIPVYEHGDTIQWVGPQLNSMLWNFVEYFDDSSGDPNYYYELYNQYSEKFISPSIGSSDALSDSPVGINLPGRRAGRYYSKIVAWDDDHYSYAGLGVNDESFTNVSTKLNEADDFYFAIVQDIPVDDVLHTVKTIDNNKYGITMKMIDFSDRNMMGNYLGNTKNGDGPVVIKGILETKLEDNNYPDMTANTNNLSGLYAEAATVNHLFIESTHKETGYFEFDSTQNFASLKGGTNFTVYRELGTNDTSSKPTLKHGQFLPYNDISAGLYASVNGKNQYTALADYRTGYEDVGRLPESDPRYGEQLYLVRNTDYYFGMELEASFTQTPDGLDDWKHPIIFEFTGDDDFWLYVNGELVLDLGGIHSAVGGYVNFASGEVNNNGVTTDLRTVFENNYRSRNKNATQQDVDDFLSQYFEGDSTVFKNYSSNTMRIFYMERGAGASNLHMRFNLASVRPGTIELTKVLSGNPNSDSSFSEYAYQIYYKKANDDTEYLVDYDNIPLHAAVKYKGTDTPVKYRPSLTIGGMVYNDVFLLKPEEIAVIELPDAETYRIVECGLRDGVYDSVKANGNEVPGTPAGTTGSTTYSDYSIVYETTKDRPAVTYENTADPASFRELQIEKVLYDESHENRIRYEQDSTLFNFRLYLGSEFDDPDNLALANMEVYYVKDNNGNYCRWDSTLDVPGFASLGTGDFNALTDEQKESATFNTSINGAISRIPVDYTVVVPNLLVGTHFKVEERDYEVPDGYSLQGYVVYDDKPETAENISDTDPTAAGSIIPAHDPYVEVHNLKGFGLRLNKVWTDAKYIDEREPTYYAIFRNDGNGNLTLISAPEPTLRQLPYGDNPQTLYWFYLRLPIAGTVLSEYEIHEVLVKDPVVNDEGYVTSYSSMTPISDGESVPVNGRLIGETGDMYEIDYTASYSTELPDGSNVRVDTITNDRPGIVLKKQDWSGNPLKGASFTLKDASGDMLGTFVSDDEGIITTAFLSKDMSYTLTETKAPHSYLGLEEPAIISVDNSGILSVSGIDEAYYTLTQAEGTTLTTLSLINRPFTIRAVKKDGTTDAPMAGVKFAPHRQVTVDHVTTIDVSAMPGYEELTTDSDGIIPGIDHSLPAGTYELREIETMEGYELIGGHIHFTISESGHVSLGQHPVGVTLTPETVPIPDEGDTSGTVEYELTILNTRDTLMLVSFMKVDMADTDHALVGAVFDLYQVSEEEGVEIQETPAIYTGLTSGESGLLEDSSGNTEFNLPPGKYHLVETDAPSGYVMKPDAVEVIVSAADVSYDDGTSISQNGSGKSYDSETGVFTLKIANSNGFVLPATGGHGTRVITILGAILTAGAGLILWRRRRTIL